MINKFVRIQQVAKFHNYSATGDVEMKPLTLIYAENGKGKSTIAAILRSLSDGNPDHIFAKKTLGSDSPQKIMIQHSNGLSEFKNDMWTQTYPNLMVFDSNYVNSNLFSGDRVEHEHKRNLYFLVIGEKCVSLAKEISDLDSKIRELGPEIQNLKTRIEAKIKGDFTIETFVEMKDRENIEEEILAQKALITSLSNANNIKEKSSQNLILLPEFDEKKIAFILQKSIDDISADVDDQFKSHCQSLGKNSEEWIRDGVDFTIDKHRDCPFCGKPLDGSKLFEIYKDYFNKAYSDLKKEIEDTKQSFSSTFSSDTLIKLQTSIEQNRNLTEFWSQYISNEFPDLDFNNIKSIWDQLVQQTNQSFLKKNNSPLEKFEFSNVEKEIILKYENLVIQINKQNEIISKVNTAIQQKKNQIEEQSLDNEQIKLNQLINNQLRYEDGIKNLCDQYLTSTKDKKDKTAEKDQKRKQLDQLTKEEIEKYQHELNTVLEKFGVDFRIIETKTSFQGGRPSASYCLSINDECIQLGSQETTDRPGFKTTLSDGEKNTLAFAFFITQLYQDTYLNEKVIVIDDPITSLDNNRRECTKQEIEKIIMQAKQVIVLSHDPFFLHGIAKENRISKNLVIRRKSRESSIEEWNIYDEVQSDYIRDYNKLVKYEKESIGERSDVAKCIRTVMESYLRVRFPDQFLPNEWLGDFIKKIRESKKEDALWAMKNHLDEINGIKDYSKKFHHGSDPNAMQNLCNVTEGELTPWVRRVLDFLRTS
jgi:wobble nucleotide-excising tRNase